ncbi:MAG: PAS domain S-box protein [Anaerolineales bacterium]|nr:PAS domain S-box protein [Anaerolineales bacterium]
MVAPDTLNVLAANPEACRLLGCTEADLLNRNFAKVIEPPNQQDSDATHAWFHSGEFCGEFTFLKADGKLLPVHVATSIVSGPYEKPVISICFFDLSAQKATEIALRESEEKWRGLFEFLPVGVSIVDMRDRVTDTNPALQEILGLSQAALLRGEYRKRRYLRQDHTEMLPEEFPSTRAMQEMKSIRNVEIGIEKEDGDAIWVSVSATPLSSGNRSATVTVDITERKRAEEALAASQALYRLLAEHSTDAVSMIDVSGKVIYTSPANMRRLGYDETDIVGLDTQGILQRIHPDDRNQIAAEIKRGRELKLPTSRYEYRVRTKAGDYIWLEDILHREFDEKGEFVRTIVNSREITERKRAEDRLRLSEERLREVLENSLDLAYKRNAVTNTYDYLSPVLTRLVGYTPEEFYNLPVETVMEFIHPEDRDRVYQSIDAVMANVGSAQQVEYRFRHKDGHYIWFQDRSTAVCDANGKAVARIGNVTDFSERRRAEDEIRRLNATLEQTVVERTAQLASAVDDLRRAAKLKDEFMAAISHELRTPLSGVLGLAEALEMQLAGPLNDRQMRYVDGIRESGERLLAMVNSILRYTNLISGSVKPDLVPHHLAELCAIAARSVRTHAEQKGQSVELKIGSINLTIATDGEGLVQVLQQLLENAVKFTPQGGKIGLEMHEDADNNAVRLIVWDTGIGMTQEQLATIFDPFVQADATLARQYEGIGLGLAYVKRMVELLGGQITVQSEVDQGSRFKVTLPIEAAGAPNHPVANTPN